MKAHRAGACLIEALKPEPVIASALVDAAISAVFGLGKPLVGLAKLRRNAPLIAAGLLVGATANMMLRTRDHSPVRRSNPARSY